MIDIVADIADELKERFDIFREGNDDQWMNIGGYGIKSSILKNVEFESSWLAIKAEQAVRKWHQDNVYGKAEGIFLASWPYPTQFLLPAYGISKKSFLEWWDNTAKDDSNIVDAVESGIAHLYTPKLGSLIHMDLETIHRTNPQSQAEHMVIRYVV